MKKTAFSLVLLLGMAAFSCSDNSGNGKSSESKSPASSTSTNSDESTPTSLNIRYIDMDSVAAKYNFALDLQEMTIRAYSKLQNAGQGREAEINKLGQQIEEKMRNNGYLSQESYDADVAKLNKMQQDAQTYLGNLQRQSEQEIAAQQQQLADSIESFIKDYNKTRGYDAILYKAAGAYFNPALDITEEVIEGLNARYNKVEKK
ncbi:MAG: OmpH family outer membrane protein [Paramuribaculum sp.]|nr:OmpH family outer membrane protein [Paramuribaculum sp.]